MPGANSLTMHPPGAPVSGMQPEGALRQDFLQLYAHAAQSVPENTRLGVENVHKLRGKRSMQTEASAMPPMKSAHGAAPSTRPLAGSGWAVSRT